MENTIEQKCTMPNALEPTKKSQRNSSIELLRIIAAIMVIFNHTWNQFYFIAGKYNPSAALINLINVCAVGCFFMITGYFLFSGNTGYVKRLSKLFSEVIVPTVVILIIIAISQSINAVIKTNMNFFTAFFYLIKITVKEILAWSFVGERAYLWFILDYIVVMIWFPILRYICVKEKRADLTRRFLIALCVFNILCGDIATIFKFNFAINPPAIFSFSVLFVLLGYELRRLSDSGFLKQNKNVCIAFGFIIYVLSVIAAIILVDSYMKERNYFLLRIYMLFTITSITGAIGLMIPFLCFDIKSEKTNKAICYLSKQTMFVYLLQSPLHVFVINVIKLKYSFFSAVLTGIGVAVVSFLLAMFVNFIKDGITSAVKNKMQRDIEQSDKNLSEKQD